MPSTRIALLRGINVGRAKRIAMADLRALVEELGYGDVRTLLNSGNVVFTAPGTVKGDPAPRIEKAIEERFGFSSRVTVISAKELAAIVDENPLADIADNPSRLLVEVLNSKADRKKLEPLLEEDWGLEVIALGDRAAYIWCPEGVLASKLVMASGRALRDAATSRNWATMVKLNVMAGEKK